MPFASFFSSCIFSPFYFPPILRNNSQRMMPALNWGEKLNKRKKERYGIKIKKSRLRPIGELQGKIRGRAPQKKNKILYLKQNQIKKMEIGFLKKPFSNKKEKQSINFKNTNATHRFNRPFLVSLPIKKHLKCPRHLRRCFLAGKLTRKGLLNRWGQRPKGLESLCSHRQLLFYPSIYPLSSPEFLNLFFQSSIKDLKKKEASPFFFEARPLVEKNKEHPPSGGFLRVKNWSSPTHFSLSPENIKKEKRFQRNFEIAEKSKKIETNSQKDYFVNLNDSIKVELLKLNSGLRPVGELQGKSRGRVPTFYPHKFTR
uniref:hypothetical protein n=1 Tax=Cephaleuros karstenii TaxID=1985640 RepID=UPI001EDE4CDF|nr:hypothetical protein MFR52_pgp018 [Cephaleuros karstenii]UIB39141.1 hypothetical protein [Cephaleuros karstenii]